MTALGDLLHRVLTTLGSVQPVPTPQQVLAVAAVALVLVWWRPTWRGVRMLVTIVHEAGHAVAAVLTGRRLSGIRLHSDTSGLTVSHGRARGPGMVATLLAGYPAATVLGVAAAAVLGTGRAIAFLWLLVAALVLMLVQIRNLFGALVLLVVGGGLAAAAWWLPTSWLVLLAHLLCWLLLLAGPRPVLELMGSSTARSDSAQLAALTRVPRRIWELLLVVVTVGGSIVGAMLSLPLAQWVGQWWGT